MCGKDKYMQQDHYEPFEEEIISEIQRRGGQVLLSDLLNKYAATPQSLNRH